MFGLNKEDKFPEVSSFTTFPSVKSVVLKVGNNLVVFSPNYLLEKHGGDSQEVSSKFYDLQNAIQLLEILQRYLSPKDLKGDRVELKELDMKMVVGQDALVKITNEQRGHLVEKEVRGGKINIIPTTADKIPSTQLMNLILVKFNPEFGQGVDKLFTQKYPKYSFENFDKVYTILTMFPGKYAPPFNDKKFWSKHALLEEIK